MSKVKISKAIHNLGKEVYDIFGAVVNMSKVKISKAIHNEELDTVSAAALLSICQR